MHVGGLFGGHSAMIVEGLGTRSLAAALFRFSSPRRNFIVFVADPPARLGVTDRFILRLADCVLVDGDAAALLLTGSSSPACITHRLSPDYGLDRFFAVGHDRSPRQARRVTVVSDLTPGSGAADLLVALSAWTEANPHASVTLTWAGEGDLLGLLAAQPLPGNLEQTFVGRLDPEQMADVFAESDLLAVPAIDDELRFPVAEALAAGLPILGSRRNRAVRHLVTEGVTGWLFDPLRPGDMLGGVTRAIETSAPWLSEMRLRAREAVCPNQAGAAPTRMRRYGPTWRAMLPAAVQQAK